MAHNRKGPVTQLKDQFDETSNSCKKLQEEYLRAIADFDNFRKRNERDNEISRRVALEALLSDLIPVLDNFERAVQVAATGASADGLQKGMDLIHKQLRDALCRHGLTEYSCVGTQFDPRRAEAISFVKTSEHEPGTVVSEICKGYACGQRVLRPARVVVAKEPEKSRSPESGVQSAEEDKSQKPGGAEAEDGQGKKAETEGAEAEAEKSGGKDNGKHERCEN